MIGGRRALFCKSLTQFLDFGNAVGRHSECFGTSDRVVQLFFQQFAMGVSRTRALRRLFR